MELQKSVSKKKSVSVLGKYQAKAYMGQKPMYNGWVFFDWVYKNMLGITLSKPAKAQLKLVQTCDKNTTSLNNSMDKLIEDLYKVAVDQNAHIKRLENQIKLLSNQVTTLQDDLISYRRDKAGVKPDRKLPMASAKADIDSNIPDMSQVNRARIRLSM